ncbi:MAG: cobalamin biosynthesis protein CbiX [Planctomycetota bacterium]|nr:MAG: cobalamin biosynthesis protein CbiX [Planctomycetota bacterium]REJ95015.1 MAG: cobalamin biosynthesis protein CbiX [Planctomycetota bacterium]REK23490.1 MAG: cobalamin biosynthesis protein CbiX [Planctomycetota bacterium]REK38985.1 MAG: cobalamin biosynthesis protein CbiX [Planctomycetota bacterium]
MSPEAECHAAILLIAHGSRSEAANAELRELARSLQEREPTAAVEIAYLELAEPTIPQGVAACLKHRPRQVRLLPYFLSAGVHVTRDLEDHRARFQEERPDVDFVLCPPIGLHPLMLDILQDRLHAAQTPNLSQTESPGDTGQNEYD